MNVTLKLKSGGSKTLELEEYVQAVVAGEMGSSWPIEALKAQAVAARTFTVYNKYKVTNNTGVYNGQAYNPSGVGASIMQAVSLTAGQILTYSGKAILSVYSASNGGRIKDVSAWNSTPSNYPYLVNKADPYTVRSGKKKNGHSIGMSQWGANQAAKEGIPYRNILQFYYPGTSLTSATGTSVGTSPEPAQTSAASKGALLVAEGRRHLGKPYVWGAEGPNTFDCSGYVWYVYRQALNYSWGRMGSTSQYNATKKKTVWTTGSSNPWYAGDLVFLTKTSTGVIEHVGMATGEGRMVLEAAGGQTQKVVETDWPSKYSSGNYTIFAATRILSDTETGTGGSYATSYEINDASIPLSAGTDYVDYVSAEYVASILTGNLDSYREVMLETISKIREQSFLSTDSVTGIQYPIGYLVDMKNGGEFRFPVPEYSVSNAVNWDTSANIPGRSVDFLGYNSTSSKEIAITVDLAAGVGYYVARGENNDPVEMMMQDIAFVESLKYPDYSKAIVLPPPMVLLLLGPNQILKGVVSSAEVSYQRPFDSAGRPMQAKLSFTVKQVSDNPPDYSDIRNRTDVSY